MKKIVSGKILRENMLEAINLLCDTVKQTLGPKGNNVIIDHSSFSPFITNDGVTIAKNIESDDPVLGSIIEIAKEASIKTNDNVGDGTTTTLVLVQSLITLAIKEINNGTNPIILKRDLFKELENILKVLNNLKLKGSNRTQEDIAMISANDHNIGKVVNEVVKKIDDKSAIVIKEDSCNNIRVQYKKGYSCEISHPSEYYFQEKSNMNFNDAQILIINDIVNSTDDISSCLNEAIIHNKSLIIIAKDFDSYLVNEIMSLNLERKVNCIMVKISEYGFRERLVQKDLEIITKATIAENSQHITGENIGIAKNIYIDKHSLRIDFKVDETIKNYVKNIDSMAIDCNDFELEFLNKRKAMFKEGIVEITIGAPTKIECHEKRMRLEDAICSTFASKNGFLLGGGVTLLNIANVIDTSSVAGIIWKETLTKPFEQIMINSGLDAKEIEKTIKENNYTKVYNVYTDSFEDKTKTKVVDAYDVIVNSLTNACSTAIMLLTTNSLIINEAKNNLNKVNEYTEL